MARKFVAGLCGVALTAVFSASTSGVALACRSRPADKAVLLERVPDEARDSPVVARVVVTDLYDRLRNAVGWRMTAEVRVVEAIRGVEVGQIVRIDASQWVCSSALHGEDVGGDGFVAGEFRSGGDGLLTGFWDLRHARTRGGP